MSRKAAIRCDCPIYCKFCGAKLRRDYVGIFFLFSSLPLWLSSSFAVVVLLERAGKPMAYIFGKHDFDALLTVMLKVLPCLIPCLFCAVEIMPNGVARHEDSCPAFLFKKWKDSLESSAKGGKKR